LNSQLCWAFAANQQSLFLKDPDVPFLLQVNSGDQSEIHALLQTPSTMPCLLLGRSGLASAYVRSGKARIKELISSVNSDGQMQKSNLVGLIQNTWTD
jgi:hypothetical protein